MGRYRDNAAGKHGAAVSIRQSQHSGFLQVFFLWLLPGDKMPSRTSRTSRADEVRVQQKSAFILPHSAEILLQQQQKNKTKRQNKD